MVAQYPFFTLLVSFSLFVTTKCLSQQPNNPAPAAKTTQLLQEVQRLIHKEKDPDQAFGVLSEIWTLDPTFPGLQSNFESCLRLKVELDGTDIQARFGLVSLLLDQERFEEASQQLRFTVNADDQYIREKSAAQLFRTNAAMCNWDTVVEDAQGLVSSLRLEERINNNNHPEDVPVLHPFEALKWPCISLSDSTRIAALYARRYMNEQGFDSNHPLQTNRLGSFVDIVPSPSRDMESTQQPRKIRIGFLSPDFTATHPMAFLIQSIFQYHDRSQFSINVYSLGRSTKVDESSPEIKTIRDGSDAFAILPLGDSPSQLADKIRQDDLDILIDLCGYTGTSKVAELLSHRPSDLQIAYMGFPASSGAPFIDYMIADQIVVPPHLRNYYTEGMIWMPHCYFVNSHVFCAKHTLIKDKEELLSLRKHYDLPRDGFVFCSHNRPDKIDCKTFQIWLEALVELREDGNNNNAVLWMLRSGAEMEKNLRKHATDDYGLPDEALVFCEIAPRDDHLRRVGCADVFLDTPSYNAHTVGCDTLFAGVPMISLLRPDYTAGNDPLDPYFVPTEKLASRVGASLLSSAELDELIAPDLQSYKSLMIKCAVEKEWFRKQTEKLTDNRFSSPLFDTKRWVGNLETAFCHLIQSGEKENDIFIQEIME